MADIDIGDEVKGIIAKQFGLDQEDIEDDSELDEDLGISDIELEDLMETIQTKFDIQIPQENYSGFKKVSDLVAYIYENSESPA